MAAFEQFVTAQKAKIKQMEQVGTTAAKQKRQLGLITGFGTAVGSITDKLKKLADAKNSKGAEEQKLINDYILGKGAKPVEAGTPGSVTVGKQGLLPKAEESVFDTMMKTGEFDPVTKNEPGAFQISSGEWLKVRPKEFAPIKTVKKSAADLKQEAKINEAIGILVAAKRKTGTYKGSEANRTIATRTDAESAVRALGVDPSDDPRLTDMINNYEDEAEVKKGGKYNQPGVAGSGDSPRAIKDARERAAAAARERISAYMTKQVTAGGATDELTTDINNAIAAISSGTSKTAAKQALYATYKGREAEIDKLIP